MATSLEKLIAQLSAGKPYQPLTQEEIDKQAKGRYQAAYDQQRLSAKQAYETSDAALAGELESMKDSYDQRRQQAAQQTEAATRQTARQSVSRGMQRSSYTGATLANIGLAGLAAMNAISQEQSQAEAAIGQKRTQLGKQLSETLAQYDRSQQADTMAYADELAAREYERGVQSANTANQLAMQLYEYQHQLEVEAQEQQRWMAEFAAKYGGKKTASSGGSGGKKKTPTLWERISASFG